MRTLLILLLLSSSLIADETKTEKYLFNFDTKEEYLDAVKRSDGDPTDLSQLDFQIFFIREVLNKPDVKIMGELSNMDFYGGVKNLCSAIQFSNKNNEYKAVFPDISNEFNEKSGSIKELFKRASDLFMCQKDHSIFGKSVGHIWAETKSVKAGTLFSGEFNRNGMRSLYVNKRWKGTETTRWIREKDIEEEIRKKKEAKK